MKKLLFLVFIIGCSVKEPVQKVEILGKSTPEAEGISSKAILDFVDAAEKKQPNALHSIMIVRHGKIVTEGWWDPYDAESPHELYSLSKSFTSTAVGLAIEEGLLNINDKVISFFPDQTPENPSTNLQSMRIRDLITMNTGHREDTWGRIFDLDVCAVTAFLSLKVEHKPGTIFVYNTGSTYMLSAIMQKVSGQTLLEFLKPRLFDPLDIEDPVWITDTDGINVGGWGLSVTTRDIAKLGQLYLQKGNWNGQQILSETWVNTATSLQTSNGSNPESDWDQGYGYQFWRCRYDNYRGDGAFGQYCLVMPTKDVVVAITSGSRDMQGILDLVWDYLLPAIQDEALPPDNEAYLELNEKMGNLALANVKGQSSSPMQEKLTGMKFSMDPNDFGVDTVAFDLNESQKFLMLWTSEGMQKVPIGYDMMLKGEVSIQNTVWLTACSGAWISEDHYRVRIYNYQTPHAITFDFNFTENGLIWDSEYNVMFGPTSLPQVSGRN